VYIAYDEQGDLLFVQLRAAEGDSASRDIGGGRFVEFDSLGAVSIEFLGASHGINLDGVPLSEDIARSLSALSQLLARSVQSSPA
jgi:uncharacterized protein YuzE